MDTHSLKLDRKLNIHTFKKEILRNSYIKLLSGLDAKYHLTITFDYGMNSKSSASLINEFLKVINRHFLKGQYNSGNKYFEGIVVRERTETMNNYHYHIILTDGETTLPSFISLHDVIGRKIQTLNNSRASGSKINTFLLQEYYDSKSSTLEHYLTKIFENSSYSINDCSDAICPIQHAGVSFND